MKTRMLMIALLAGFLSLTAQAGFEQFGDPAASCWVTPQTADPAFFMFYDVAALEAVTTDDRTFAIKPNTALYAGGVGDPIWRNNGGVGPDGNSDVEANLLWEIPSIGADATSASVTFNVADFDIDTIRYTVTAFVKVLNPLAGYAVTVSDLQVLTGPLGSTTLTVDLTGQADRILQIGVVQKGLNANPVDDWGSATITFTDMGFTSSDLTAPTPNPATLASAVGISDSKVEVTATVATDAVNGVEYKFFNQTTGEITPWQASNIWLDDGPDAAPSTQSVTIVNATYDANITGWGNAGTGLNSWTAAGNGTGALLMDCPAAGWHVSFNTAVQDVTAAGFLPGETVTISCDVQLLAGDGTGVGVKFEAFNAANVKLSDTGDQYFTGLTASWQTISLDYVLPADTASIKIVPLTVLPTLTTSVAFDNWTVEGVTAAGTALTPSTSYNYYCQFRDTSANLNETAWSTTPVVGTTMALDLFAPTPDPMTMAATAVSPSTVKLTATTATDPSGVEYYFTCTAGDGNDSGWQDSPIYYDVGVSPSSNYTYTVTARDKAAAVNTGAPSAGSVVTTMAVAGPVSFTDTLKGYTGTASDMDNRMIIEQSGLTTGSVNPQALIAFDASGATVGSGVPVAGRDVLRTISTGYDAASFEAYATFTFPGVADFAGFIGMGQGVLTGVPDNWGVPELNMAGVNGVVAQFKDVTAGDTANPWCQLFRMIEGNPADSGGSNITGAAIGATETIRAKLVYDATAQTVTVSYDRAYAGGAFVEDVVLGTLGTAPLGTSMFLGQPARVYVGGGEGTLVSDFEVIVTGGPVGGGPTILPPTFSGGFMFFSWTGEVGKSYDVMTKASMTDATWTLYETLTGVAGTMTSTPSTANPAAFYKLEVQ